jgi:magnesium-transporting ATPase (P-type)
MDSVRYAKEVSITKDTMDTDFEELSTDQALDKLSADADNGLDEDEIDSRLEKYGKNKIEEEEQNPILQFLSYFWGPIPWMIEAAVILSAVGRRWEDLVVITSLLRGDPVIQVLIFAMVLIIAGIPAALPAVVLSVTMSIGAKRLAAWKAIVSRLASMEEMAGLEVLCADKTGTLTKNELELQERVVIQAENKNDLLLAAALTVDRDSEDPIDKAVLAGLDNKEALDDFNITDFTPFDPTRKRADAQVNQNGNRFTVSKGAPQVIMEVVEPDEETRNKVEQTVADLGEKGFRALGVARKAYGKWAYLGVLPLLDPPREDTAEVIDTAKNQYYIDIRMVTGDHPAIGKQVAGQIGLGQDIRTAGEVFQEESDGDADCRLWISRASHRVGLCPGHLGICPLLAVVPQCAQDMGP